MLRRFGEAFGPEYAIDLRMRYFRALESMPLGKLSGYHSGYLLSIVSAVAEGLGALAIEVFWGLSRSVANLTLFFYFTAEQSVPLAVMNFIILLAFIALSTRFSQRMVPLTTKLNEQRAKLSATYADFAANVPTVKRLGISKFAEARLEKISTDTFALVKQLQAYHARRWFTLHAVFSVALITTVSFLLWQISHGAESASVLILFVAAFTAVRLNAERLSESFRSVLELDGYIETMLKVLDTAPGAGGQTPSDWSVIELRDVEHRYTGSSVNIRIPQLTIRKGEKIGLSGASGQGKTTILHIVANLLEPASGTRTIDGVPFEKISDDFFQSRTVVVSQEAELLNLSVRDNLLLGGKTDDRTLLALLAELGLDTWIQSVDRGLDGIIGERGITVSQGQKQRLNLLRGYLLNRDIMLLDEPTAHLDDATAVKVINFIESRCAEKTLLIVSHKPLPSLSTQLQVVSNTLRKVSETADEQRQ